jgi:DNA-binding NtrC family response regulator
MVACMRILVADDDATTRFTLDLFCRGQEFDVQFAASGRDAIAAFRQGNIDAVVTDVRMPDLDGEGVLRAVRQVSPETPVLIMTAHGTIDDAVRFLHHGADDYIAKPISQEVFLHRIRALLDRVRLAREVKELRASKSAGVGTRIIGHAPSIAALERRLPMTAQTDASIVIYGESGTGKELVAMRLHELSKRATKRFVTVNCGALSDTLLESELFGYRRGAFTDAHRDTPGLVEEAEGGTLFLDEIGEISLSVQVKLLRFLQSKEFKALGSPKIRHADVRIIAATNRELKVMVDRGTFREDLYYRLNIVPLHVPPLRDRKSDIPLLAAHFLHKFRTQFDKDVRAFSPEVIARIMSSDWPGNVRELENKVQQLVVLATGPLITEFEMTETPSVPTHGDLGPFREEKKRLLDDFEHAYVKRMLDKSDGNLSLAARQAGLDRKNFWALARRHGLWPGREVA